MEMTSPPPDIHENPSDETLRLIRVYTVGTLANLRKTRDFDRIAEGIVNTIWTTFLRTPVIGKENLLNPFWSAEKLGEINDALKSSDTTIPEIFLEESIIAEELYMEGYTPEEAAKIITKMRNLESPKQVQRGFQRQVSNVIASTEYPRVSTPLAKERIPTYSRHQSTNFIPRPPRKV